MVRSGRDPMQATLGWAVSVGAALGLAGAALELSGLAYLKLFTDSFLFLPRASVWWIPLVMLVGTAFVTGATWTLGAVLRVTRRPGVIAGAGTTWAVLSPLFVAGQRLHPGALLVIALGVGVQVGRTAGRHPERAVVAARRGGAFLALVLLAGAIGFGRFERQLRLAESTPTRSAPANAPNVLIVLLDTVRALDLSLYGYDLPTTPELEALAPSSVVFDRAIATAPWTVPSHASLFTGRWPSQVRGDWRTPLEGDRTTLAEIFRANGYRTGGFSANVDMMSVETGLAQGFERFEDRPTTPAEMLRSDRLGRMVVESGRTRLLLGPEWGIGRKPAPRIRESFVAWLDRSADGRPFFAFLNLFDAHRPYSPGDLDRGRFGPVTRERLRTRIRRAVLDQAPTQRDSATVRGTRHRYDEAIAAMDREIGLIVDELARRGQLDNTILVVTSDHGELFGEHGLLTHGNSLYANLLRVPLVIRAPSRAPAGTRLSATVSLRDLARTVLDLAGLDGPIEGASLAALWSDAAGFRPSPAISMVSQVPDARARVPVSRGDMASVVVESLHYIRNGDGSVEVYDLATDPYERTSLAAVLPVAVLDSLRSRLLTVWTGDASLAPPLDRSTWQPALNRAPRIGRPAGQRAGVARADPE